jgi:hypothetical protein
MAVVTITLSDTLHGTIEIGGEMDPPLDDDLDRTPAQELGFRLLKEFYAIQEAGRLQRATYGIGDPDGTKN